MVPINRPVYDVFPGAFEGRDCEMMLEDASIEHVVVSLENQRIKVYMNTPQLLPQELIDDAEQSINDFLKDRLEVVMHVRYTDLDIEENEEEYREHLLKYVCGISQHTLPHAHCDRLCPHLSTDTPPGASAQGPYSEASASTLRQYMFFKDTASARNLIMGSLFYS